MVEEDKALEEAVKRMEEVIERVKKVAKELRGELGQEEERAPTPSEESEASGGSPLSSD